MQKFEQPKFEIDTQEVKDYSGKFVLGPLERGYGTTIGNSMRRVLLSSLPGLAVYAVEVEGARHEYTPLPGIVEDLTQIILNIKDIVLKDESDRDEDHVLTLKIKTLAEEKTVTAGDIVCPDMISVCNKDLVLFHMAPNAYIKMVLHAKKGVGFVTAELNKQEGWPIGYIAIDSNFSPIKNASLEVKPYGVGKDASYEKLIINVETDGSMKADEAVALAGKILDEHFKVFETLHEAVKQNTIFVEPEQAVINKFTQMTLEDLDLSVRSFNCLKRNGLKTVQDLCNMKEAELMTVRNLGKKSYKEILDKLAACGCSLQRDDNKRN